MVEDKSEHSSEHKRSKKIHEKVRENPWIVSTIILGILVLVLVASSFSGITGNVVSGEKAGSALVEFLNVQTGGGVEYVSYENSGSLYEVLVLYEDNEIPVYVTKDGKYYVSGVVPIAESDSSEADSGSSTQTYNVPKSDKPEVELFVMSHCPYGTQAEKGILPVLNLLGDKIDFNLRFVYYAMHPSYGEVEEQLNQYCIQKEQSEKLYSYLECFLTEGDGDGCLVEAGIDKTKLNACTASADKEFSVSENKDDKSSWLNGNYPLFDIDKELNEEYGVGGSPTLVINGQQVSSARDPASYLDAICQSFTDGNVPSECDTQLSAESLSPGFGWTTASGSSASAQCY